MSHMRRRIHVSYESGDTCPACFASYEEEDTCHMSHMRRRIHVSYESGDTCPACFATLSVILVNFSLVLCIS